jgi:hypothetical protein
MSTKAKSEAAPADWRARYGELVHQLSGEGLHMPVAAEGAWWRLTAEAILAGVGRDQYEAEAALARLGLQAPPFPKMPARWSRLRDGDSFSPGTNDLRPKLPDWPQRFAWSPDADYRPPASDRKRDPDPGDVLRAWHAAHRFEPVRMEHIAREVVDLVAPRAVTPQSVSPGEIWQVLRRLNHAALGGSMIFKARDDGGDGLPALSLDRRFVVPPMEAFQVSDPAMETWAARFVELVNVELRDGIGRGWASDEDARMQEAKTIAFDQLAAEFAEATGISGQGAKATLREAGFDPRHDPRPGGSILRPPSAPVALGWRAPA